MLAARRCRRTPGACDFLIDRIMVPRPHGVIHPKFMPESTL
jgi:hypothetical protein